MKKTTPVVLAGLIFTVVFPSRVHAIVPGQTGEFPSTGPWSGTTNTGATWSLANCYVYQWNVLYGGTWYINSAVAVAPNYLLTAGHVMPSGTTVNQCYTTIGGTTYTAVSDITPPDDPGQSSAPDLCLIKVNKTLPGYNSLYSGSFSYGQSLFLTGYGLTGTYNSSAYYFTLNSGTDGVERWGTNSVYWTPYESGSSMIFGSSAYGVTTTFDAFLGNGDSGGGEFIKAGNDWELAGINDGIYSNGVSGEYYATAAIDVANYDSWINANITVPEPSSFTLLAVTSVGLLARRHRAVSSKR